MSVSQATIPRAKMIAERQKRSVAWRIIHLLGSLQLALILLATIAVACAMATFAESSFNTKVAQAYIYKAPWFFVWLGVLCVNLFAVTLTRWPWQKKHVGFVVTHYGIITLLLGAMVGLQFGFEGHVTLNKKNPPVRQVTANRSIIQVESPADGALYVMPFDASIARPTEKHPRILPVPGTSFRIIVDAFSDNLVKEQKLASSQTGGPGVHLRLKSERMNQRIDMPLAMNGKTPHEEDFFGLASIILQPSLPQAAQSAAASETQMVFARFAPVVQSESEISGIRVLLSEDGSQVTLSGPDSASVTYRRSEILKSPLTYGPAVVMVEDYWPDFEMREGRPSTKSQVPNNPAILVRIQMPGKTAKSKPRLTLAPDGAGITYQLERNGAVYASGHAKVGDKFSLGWADWEAEIAECLPQALVISTTKPGPPSEKGEQGIPGFRARLESPGNPPSEPSWVESGNISSLTNGQNTVRMGYGLELRSVPFLLRLLNFEVPRYEGTETPSNFIATVEFEDLKTGAKKVRTAKMNHPASFPGTFAANITGINYKFSQAEWNPRDLGETTLQVLYDPGWLLKWIGSLGICLGIAMMFYLKPKSQ